MKKTFKIFGLILLMALMSTKGFTQSQYKLYSGFIYHFATKTQWPAAQRNGDFVIGVLGSSPIIGELNKLAAVRKVGSRKIVVKKYNSVAEMKGCHIVFVPSTKMSMVSSVSSKAKPMHAMVITETASGMKKGAIVGFTKDASSGTVRFKLNNQYASASGLTVSNDLKRLAI